MNNFAKWWKAFELSSQNNRCDLKQMKLKMKDKTNSICFVLVIEIYILNSPCFSFKQMKFANPDVFREFLQVKKHIKENLNPMGTVSESCSYIIAECEGNF